jgi:hypothetical protein
MGGRCTRNRIPRVIAVAFVFLLLGAIVNVAVAWIPVFTYFPRGERMLSAADATRRWDSLELPWNPPGEAWGWDQLMWGWRITDLGRPVQFAGTTNAAGVAMIVSGWPCDSMLALGGYWKGEYLRIGWRHPDLWPLPEIAAEALPTSIHWPGFAINTLFYAGILWLLFVAPFVLRRRRRIKRGLCPACAYPVGESDVCTECGKQLPSPSR